MRRIIIGFVILAAIVGLSIVGLGASRSELTVDTSKMDRNPNMRVYIGDSEIEPSGNGGNTYSRRLGAGKHKIRIAHPVYQEYNSETDIGVFTKKTETPNPERKTAAIVAGELSNNETVVISEPIFHGNSSWVTYFTNDVAGNYDGSVVVAHFSKKNGQWEIISEGTAFDTLDSDEEIPDSVIKYLETL